MNESFYVLVSDDDEVMALFKQQNSEESVRADGTWGNPMEEEIEEWDGARVVTIVEDFVEIYDKKIADDEVLMLEDIEEYRVKKSND